MGKRKVHFPEKAWKELKRKYVDQWEPTEEDIDWLLSTVKNLKIHGLWYFPAAGATFEKVGSDHLVLKSVETNDPLSAMISIEKTKKVGEKAGIKVDTEDTEETADHIFFRL